MLEYRRTPPVDGDALNRLFFLSWPGHQPIDFEALLGHGLGYVVGYQGHVLVAFARLAWDGGRHAFLLEPTVHPDWRHQGIGRQIVREAIRLAQDHGIQWVHVDYEPHLKAFYARCGFKPTDAGLINLRER